MLKGRIEYDRNRNCDQQITQPTFYPPLNILTGSLMSTENELQHLKTQIQNLKAEVTKWSQYCAYVAGTSIGNYSIHIAVRGS